MSRLNEYNPEFGVVFDAEDDRLDAMLKLLLEQAKNKGGGTKTTPEQIARARKPIYSDTNRRTLSANEDSVPAPGEEGLSLPLPYLLDAWKKGVLKDEKVLRQAMAEQGYANPKDQDMLMSLSRRQPAELNMTALTNAKKKGLMNDAAIKQRLMNSDYTPEDADILMSLMNDSIEKDNPKLNLTQMQSALKNGLMRPEQMMAQLAEQGYKQSDIDVLMGLTTEANKGNPIGISALGEAYKRGRVDDKQVMERLMKDYELSPEDANLMMASFKQNDFMSFGQLGEVYKGGGLDYAQARDRLIKEQGYSEKDADLLMGMFDRDNAKDKAREAERLADRAEADRRQADNDKRRDEADRKQEIRERIAGFQGEKFDDGVQGYLNNFRKSFVDQLKGANLGPAATRWLMDNQPLALKEQLKAGGGTTLGGAQLMTLYEGQRGIDRKQGQTNQKQISAQKVGG